jgi:hypothetical protein
VARRPGSGGESRERAYRLYRERGDERGSARLALQLAEDALVFRAEEAVFNGWMQRARRLLDSKACLQPIDDGYIETPFEYADEEPLLRALLASGPATLAIKTSGEDAVRHAVLGACAPFGSADGGYRIETEWRDVTAKA